MTIKELIEVLKQYDENLIAYRDYEGCYRNLHEDEFEVTEKGVRISVDY